MPGAGISSWPYVLRFVMAAMLSASCESSRIASVPTTPTAPFPIRSTDPIIGLYTLSLNVESACPIPEAARNRTYTAEFDSKGDNSYVVTLSNAKFLMDEQYPGGGAAIHCGGGLGCNQFLVLRQGNVLQFQLTPTPVGDADNEFFTAGGTIAELISPDSRLNISGTGIGALESPRIEASLKGDVSYSASISTPHNYIYCSASTVRLTFARR